MLYLYCYSSANNDSKHLSNIAHHMPQVSRFLGIIISIYFEEDAPHHLPHFHVRYNRYRASYGIIPIVQLAGALPVRQQRLVEAWAELHQDELLTNWQLVQQGRKPRKIKGLT